MAKVLVKWNPDWADECDFPGFEIFTEEKWEQYQQMAKEEQAIFWGFGTNQDKHYDDPEEFLDELSACRISDEDAKIIEKHLGLAFGSYLPDQDEMEIEAW